MAAIEPPLYVKPPPRCRQRTVFQRVSGELVDSESERHGLGAIKHDLRTVQVQPPGSVIAIRPEFSLEQLADRNRRPLGHLLIDQFMRACQRSDPRRKRL